MIMTEATAGLADRLAKLKRRVWQETYTGIYPAQKLLEFDEAQHAEKFPAVDHGSGKSGCAASARKGRTPAILCWENPARMDRAARSASTPLFDIGFSTSRLGQQVWQEIEHRVKQAGFTVFGCRCNEHNERALAFYRRQGGVEIARESGHADRSEDQISLLFHVE